MEDKFGELISKAIKTKVCGDLMGYWNGVHDSGEVLRKWTDLSLDRKDHFRKTFEAKYPWLRLCEASWKVDHLWINYFRTWKKKTRGESGVSTPEPADAQDPNSIPAPDPKPIIKRTSKTANSLPALASKVMNPMLNE